MARPLPVLRIDDDNVRQQPVVLIEAGVLKTCYACPGRPTRLVAAHIAHPGQDALVGNLFVETSQSLRQDRRRRPEGVWS